MPASLRRALIGALGAMAAQGAVPSPASAGQADAFLAPATVARTFTLTPVADAYVSAANPTARSGTGTALRSDGDPVQRSYLRFDVPAFSGVITSATLRVFVTSPAKAQEVRGVSDTTWDERALAWSSAPAREAQVRPMPAAGQGAWAQADVTALVSGSGPRSLAIDGASTTAVAMSSREGAQPAELVIELNEVVNSPPSAGPVDVAATSGETASWTPDATDPDGDPLTCEIVDAPAHGVASVAPDCSSGTYTPAAGYGGADAFTYRAMDDEGAASGPAAVSATVNRRPHAAGASLVARAGEETPWSPSASDPDGDLVTCEVVEAPANGIATVAEDCSAGTYASDAGFTGDDAFAYRATDEHGAASLRANVAVAVSAGNRPPATGDTALVAPPATETAWSPEVADPDGHAVRCEVVAPPARGSATVAPDCSRGSYTSRAGVSGADDFTYRAIDAAGAQSPVATVGVEVDPDSVFAEGFEIGDLARWTRRSAGVAVVDRPARTGANALRASSQAGVSWARKALPAPLPSSTVTTWVRLEDPPAPSSFTLLKLRTASDRALVGVVMGSDRRVRVSNDFSRAALAGRGPAIELGGWHRLDLTTTVRTGGEDATIELRQDGELVTRTDTASLGSEVPGMLQLGELSSTKTYTAVFDDVNVRGTEAADDDAPVVAAAGDIACDPSAPSFNGGSGTATNCRQAAVADLIAAEQPDAVLTLGDNQYEQATGSQFTRSYDLSWGRLKAITKPAIGNHEYLTADASGYFDYFGSAAGERGKGWYSFDLGAWHIVALNSNCSSKVACGAGSEQWTWLKEDLETHPNRCTLAYFHHPLFSSGKHGGSQSIRPLWNLLDAHGVEVALAGHDHTYERFAPQTPTGVADPAGVREFVVGTGGKNHYPFRDTVAPNSQARDNSTFGALLLTLRADGYSWRFLPAAGGVFQDRGSDDCHGPRP